MSDLINPLDIWHNMRESDLDKIEFILEEVTGKYIARMIGYQNGVEVVKTTYTEEGTVSLEGI